MRMIYDNTPDPSEEDNGDGSISFEMGGYTYFVGELDGEVRYIQRQLTVDFFDGKDNWEEPEWIGSNRPQFKFLKD